MVLCDICDRPYHLQCLQPPRSVVPDDPWHSHLCEDVYLEMEEFCRDDDPILFSRPSDPYYTAHSQLLHAYVPRQEADILQYRQALTDEETFNPV